MNLYNLVAKLSLDSSGYESGIAKASDSFGKLSSLVGTGLKTAVGVGVAATGAAVAGVTALTKESIESYADYEQLIGGVETLFGNAYSSVEEYANAVGIDLGEAEASWEAYSNRQQTVLKNSQEAYKTSGLSMNQYMETATGFAAALNSSLGEYAYQSADYVETAIVSMADNSNKMGTAMESIQNAFTNFSRGNFTMLDNLKLG